MHYLNNRYGFQCIASKIIGMKVLLRSVFSKIGNYNWRMDYASSWIFDSFVLQYTYCITYYTCDYFLYQIFVLNVMIRINRYYGIVSSIILVFAHQIPIIQVFKYIKWKRLDKKWKSS